MFTKELLEIALEIVKFFRQKFGQSKAGDAIVQTAAIYDEMRKIVDDPENGIGRFMILKCHNGGGDIKSGTPQYVSTIHEEVRLPFTSVKKDYQKLSIDGAYVEMLKEIYLKQYKDYNRALMERGSLLYDIYSAEKVTHSRIFFPRHSKNAFWFCSLATHEPVHRFDEPETKLAVRLAVNNIKNLIK